MQLCIRSCCQRRLLGFERTPLSKVGKLLFRDILLPAILILHGDSVFVAKLAAHPARITEISCCVTFGAMTWSSARMGPQHELLEACVGFWIFPFRWHSEAVNERDHWG
jgi:hypothetical protein